MIILNDLLEIFISALEVYMIYVYNEKSFEYID